MSPIERVQARAAAVSALELGYHSNAEEIREAWHRIALECHPDQDSGQTDRFIRAKLARDFLIGDDRCKDSGEPADEPIVPRRVRAGNASAGRFFTR